MSNFNLLPFCIVLLKLFFETEGRTQVPKDKRYLRREKYINGLSNFVPTEFDMPTTKLVFLHGYQAESHTVITDDGYILTVHRILPNLKNDAMQNVALLHHGLLGSSADWVLLGTKKALPYLLSDAGYDVWLANAIGNVYSRAHVKYLTKSLEFWDFSWHEVGMYDMLAVVEHIRKTTDSVAINFIGHSMGATALFVFLSAYPQYNRYFANVILLGPLSFMSQVRGPLRILAENMNNEQTFMDIFQEKEFMMINKFPDHITKKICSGTHRICSNTLLFLTNGGHVIVDGKLLENILGHVPAGTSSKTIKHYCQLINSGQFHMYDLGTKENIKKFGMMSPPLYSLRNVTVPVAVFSATHDWLSTLQDNKQLLTHVNYFRHHIIKKQDFSHADFIWGEDAYELVFVLILETLGNNKLDLVRKVIKSSRNL